MLLAVNTLRSPHVIKFSSSDPWLKRIAGDLAPSAPETVSIDGEISLRIDNAGFVHAVGKVTARAIQPCDRCGRDLNLPLASEIRASFRPPFEGQPPRDANLSSEDLDIYFIENGQLDIELLINDTLQCAIPSQILCEQSDPDGCGNHSPSEDEETIKEQDRSNSPFAVLKSLK